MVEKEIVLPVERERAWELMTEEPEEWLADEVELEPEPGAPLRATWDDGEERTGRGRGGRARAAAALPLGRRRTGIPSRVEWRLDEVPGGTRVRVLETPLVPVEVRGWIAHGPGPPRSPGEHAARGVTGGARRTPRATIPTPSSPRSRTRPGGR